MNALKLIIWTEVDYIIFKCSRKTNMYNFAENTSYIVKSDKQLVNFNRRMGANHKNEISKYYW